MNNMSTRWSLDSRELRALRPCYAPARRGKNSQRASGCRNFCGPQTPTYEVGDVAVLANAIGASNESFARQCSEHGEKADRVTLSRPQSSSRARTGTTRHLGTIS